MGTVINQLVNQARQSLCINSFSITLNGVTASNDPEILYSASTNLPYSASSRNARFPSSGMGAFSQAPAGLSGSIHMVVPGPWEYRQHSASHSTR